MRTRTPKPKAAYCAAFRNHGADVAAGGCDKKSGCTRPHLTKEQVREKQKAQWKSAKAKAQR